jgi:zinc protease
MIEIVAEVNTKDPAKLEKVRDAMLAVLNQVTTSGVSQEEVDRARQKILKNRELAAADPNRIAVELSEWGAQGDWRLYFLNRDRIEQVTPAQVKEIAEKYFATSNRTVGFFVPTEKAERTMIPPAPDIAKLVDGYKGRAAKSESSETNDVAPLAIEARVVRPEPIGGVKLAFLPRKTRGESVQLRLVLHYGTADNLGGGGSLGSLTFVVQTRRANFAAVLEILRQILREPTLPASDFDLVKNERIAGLEQGRSDPRALGIIQIQRLLSPYPSSDVRYVPTIDERLDRLKKASLDQVKSLYQSYLGADHGELAIVGDFEPSEIMPILAKTFDGWKADKPYARIEHPYQSDLKPERITIITPDKDNAVYVAGVCLPIMDDNPDYPALVIGNFVLGGGGLSSRIANRLRQKDGLSYGAGSSLGASPVDPRADLLINAIYNPVNVTKVVSDVDEEVQRLLKDGVTASELEGAKNGYLQQQHNMRTNDMAITGVLSENLFVGRTMQYQAELEQKNKDLTPEAVNAALRRHVDPARLSVVTAGDFNRKK